MLQFIYGQISLFSICEYDIRSFAVKRVCLLEETKIITGLPSENFLIWLNAGLFIVAILGQ